MQLICASANYFYSWGKKKQAFSYKAYSALKCTCSTCKHCFILSLVHHDYTALEMKDTIITIYFISEGQFCKVYTLKCTSPENKRTYRCFSCQQIYVHSHKLLHYDNTSHVFYHKSISNICKRMNHTQLKRDHMQNVRELPPPAWCHQT